MLECLIFTFAGALVFASGIAFEKLLAISEEETEEEIFEEEAGEIPQAIAKQWENLLGYDGNEQEAEDENI
ncbi:MAG: hypothetical protein IKM21_00065 [Oscillospiraceae bacterium]|nr:hypothetical protein [Oscillospiraceae bacterium]